MQMATLCSCFLLFDIHRSAYGFSDATTNKRVRAFLFLWRTEKFFVTFYLFSGRETTTREHWFHVSFFFCTWICATLPCKVWWEFNPVTFTPFFPCAYVVIWKPSEWEAQPTTHISQYSIYIPHIRSLESYLIENTFDARPTTSFAFHVLFRLRSVARVTANGFGRCRLIPTELQFLFSFKC